MGTTTGVVSERTNWPQGDGGRPTDDPPRRTRGMLDEDDRRSASSRVIQAYATRLGRSPSMADLSDTELDHRVSVGAAQIAAATCRWLDHVAEFVIRGLWGSQGAKSPAEWLSWKCGISPTTARENVRVALRLRELHKTRARFAAGTLSYSKVRAITRLADPAMEDMLLAYADGATAAVLDRIVRDTARCRDNSRKSDAARRRRTGVVHRSQSDGTIEVVMRMLPADAAALRTRLDRLVELDEAADRAEGVEDGPGRGERQVRVVTEAMAAAVASGPTDTSGQDRHLVVVHAPVRAVEAAIVEPDAPAEAPDSTDTDADAATDADVPAGAPPREDRRTVLVRDGHNRHHPMRVATLRRLACLSRVDLAVDRDGSPHDQGTAKREPSAALRRQLLERDRGCRFPRCGSSRRLHAHHIQHWEHGGATDLSNLIMLCSYHHVFVHEKGWEIRPHPVTGAHALYPPASDQRRIEDRLVGASADAVRVLTEEWGLELDHESLLPRFWDGRGYDHDLAIELLFREIVATNRLDAPAGAPGHG